MNGQENDPINEYSLAALLGSTENPYVVVIGKPPKGTKNELKTRTFNARVQKKTKE